MVIKTRTQRITLTKYLKLRMLKNISYFIVAIAMVSLTSSCKRGGGGSSASDDYTGWQYNDQEWGGYEKREYEGQIDAPNLVLIEGGTFTMGTTDQDVIYEWNSIPRRVTVSSFYMDETEVSNAGWRLYTDWLKRTYISYPMVSRQALPDSLVWREELAANEPFVETYFRHPAYDDYPVVGVSWEQTQDYCIWRTDRVNEMLLIKKGILNPSPDAKDSDVFSTQTYLAGQYQGNVRKNVKDFATGGERPVTFSDGILVPSYRLPTEAEWEYAALGLQGNRTSEEDELISDRKIYPWNGTSARYQKRNKNQGDFLANFKRSRGDYMGAAGNLNDNAHITAPVRSNWPNDYGLYNMAGNVNEWVEDVYRPLTSTTLRDSENHDLNSFRGNRYRELLTDEDGNLVEKDSLGRLKYRYLDDDEVTGRENYNRANVTSYKDGDDDELISYEYGVHSLVNDETRVIKGGSWADRLYWLSPGTRRFKSQDKSDKTIGFRCAMTRVGSPGGNNSIGGQQFSESSKKKKRRYK